MIIELAEIAKNRGHLHIYELVKSFEPSNDPIETQARQAKIRLKLRKELGLNVNDAANLLALVVLSSDDYLQFKRAINDENANRLFQINLKLPLELQTIMCNYTYVHPSITISTKLFDEGLAIILRSFQRD